MNEIGIVEKMDLRGVLPTGHPANRPADRPVGAIERIVVHYDGVERPERYDPVARYKSEANYHIDKDWGTDPRHPIRGFGLMYHLKIDAWGVVYLCNDFERVLWHARVANYDGLAVCVDLGPYQQPTWAQLSGLQELLIELCYHHPEFPAGRGNVWGHLEIRTNRTACPGALLPYVRRFRATQW